MRKHLTIAAGAVAALAITASANAADMPVYKTPIIAVYSWTGCYIGGHLGLLWVHKDWNRTATNGVADPFNLQGHDGRGPLGGFQAGCNYQVSNWVFGIQGDYAWTDAKGSNLGVSTVQGTRLTDYSRVSGLGSVTGRIGYAWDRALLYVKGGWAWERDRYNVQGNDDGAVSLYASETRGGWTVGIGGEYAFVGNWTAFAEYDYYDFGTRNLLLIPDTTAAGARTYNWNVDIRERKSVFKLGINYKFGGGAVVAKY